VCRARADRFIISSLGKLQSDRDRVRYINNDESLIPDDRRSVEEKRLRKNALSREVSMDRTKLFATPRVPV